MNRPKLNLLCKWSVFRMKRYGSKSTSRWHGVNFQGKPSATSALNCTTNSLKQQDLHDKLRPICTSKSSLLLTSCYFLRLSVDFNLTTTKERPQRTTLGRCHCNAICKRVRGGSFCQKQIKSINWSSFKTRTIWLASRVLTPLIQLKAQCSSPNRSSSSFFSSVASNLLLHCLQ